MSDARYYRLSPKFWSDPMVLRWDDDTRLLALYLLTCPHRTTEGLFRLPRMYAMADLGWTSERFAKGFDRLRGDGFIEWDPDAEVVLIVKALQWQSPDNPNQVKSAVRALAMVPETPLKGRFVRLAERYCERLVEGLPEGFGEGIPDPQALTQPQSPPPSLRDVEHRNGQEPADDQPDQALESFEQFWSVYPPRQGKKLGRGNALIEWRKLTVEQRRRAYRGAKHLAASDTLPKDAERFLRRAKGGRGDFPFDDWQEPPPAATGGTVHNELCPKCEQVLANHDDETCLAVQGVLRG